MQGNTLTRRRGEVTQWIFLQSRQMFTELGKGNRKNWQEIKIKKEGGKTIIQRVKGKRGKNTERKRQIDFLSLTKRVKKRR